MRARFKIASRHLVIGLGLTTVVVWLWNLGPSDVRIPPTSLAAVITWIDRHDAVTLAFALVRIEALVLAGYLLALTALSAVVRILELPTPTRLVDRLTLPFLRGMFGGVAALGVIAAPTNVHHPAPSPPTTTPVLAPIEDPTATAILHLEVPTPAPAPAPSAEPPRAFDPAPAPAAAPAVEQVDTDDTWVVQPGDSLWSIAASHLADVSGTPASDAEVTDMWHRLIDLNRDRLVNRDDPDLIFADQVFVLPAMEAG